MNRYSVFVVAVVACLGAGAFAFQDTEEESNSDRQSVSSARDLYQKAIREFAVEDRDSLHTLRKAVERYDDAVKGEPTDMNLFIERCRAKRLLAEKSDPVDGRTADKSLEWLIRQQRRAGNWAFDDSSNPKESPGEVQNYDSIKGTAITLLAMFGAGQSQRDGRWKNEIESGLTFLISEAKVDAEGIDLRGPNGNAVTHAVATMLLCEAYEATEDARLATPAQLSVRFLESLQNADEGGWCIVDDEGPRMISTAWCVMALQSAKRARLKVEPNTRRGIEKFLGSRQTEDGAYYGEAKAGKELRATAAGLLCRCLLGWTNKNAALVKGAEFLAAEGTIADDAEARFLAAQVMFHIDGDLWRTWNRKTRDLLIAAQARDGHDQGSWYFEKDRIVENRSRLWHTAMSTLTLEVFYRYLQLFNRAETQGLVEIE